MRLDWSAMTALASAVRPSACSALMTAACTEPTISPNCDRSYTCDPKLPIARMVLAAASRYDSGSAASPSKLPLLPAATAFVAATSPG